MLFLRDEEGHRVIDKRLKSNDGTAQQDVGLVLQAIGGQCRVQTPSGEVLQCRLRGRIKLDGLRVLPGDEVRFSQMSASDGVVEEVLPRRTLLQRPYIANVDQVVVVMAAAEPAPNLDLLDRILVAIGHERLEPLVVWNKADLVDLSHLQDYMDIYRQAGYATVATSPMQDIGRDDLIRSLTGRVTVLAGASGVGKSSLLNWLFAEERFETGEVSERLQRGRHTTRSVQLVPLEGQGWIADSPGFSVLDLSGIPKEELGSTYPDIATLHGGCRFSGCLHRTEPGCQVRAAVDEGTINRGRYERYLRILGELEESEARRY